MAISPEYLSKAFQKEVDDFESKLDEKLSKETIISGGSVSIDPPGGMSIRHFNLLKPKYISAGWTDVKWNSDQREGTWITFHY
jgi:hypothetical protein